jgi:hypothetical protein
MEIIFNPASLLIMFILVGLGLSELKKEFKAIEIVIGLAYLFTIVLFAIGMITHDNPYHKAIDPVDMECYSPFSEKDDLTLIFYFLINCISILLIWSKKNILPPLILTLSLIFIFIGVLISFVILYHVSVHKTESLFVSNEGKILFFFAPIFNISIGIYLINQVMSQELSRTIEKTYANKYLNSLNVYLPDKYKSPYWLVIFMFPIFFICTLLLILFGQDANSIINVFTDTTTWNLSQKAHPPILSHKGHYLCTVAAVGHPNIVKPLRMGKRNGYQIIVNRQLLIANAFEELIQDISPKAHKVIRKNYDKYGYNLSTNINTKLLSSITYIFMKPLEWFFLICLYSFCINPEKKINGQYI